MNHLNTILLFLLRNSYQSTIEILLDTPRLLPSIINQSSPDTIVPNTQALVDGICVRPLDQLNLRLDAIKSRLGYCESIL